jgi:hypothetical protein
MRKCNAPSTDLSLAMARTIDPSAGSVMAVGVFREEGR